jgi:hypothetical protein
MRLQRGFYEGLPEASATWQPPWREQWPTHAPMNPDMVPWQEWLKRTQSTATDMPYRRAGRGAAGQVTQFSSASSATSPVSSGREKQGEHHVG